MSNKIWILKMTNLTYPKVDATIGKKISRKLDTNSYNEAYLMGLQLPNFEIIRKSFYCKKHL
jgi:hypothetical protein